MFGSTGAMPAMSLRTRYRISLATGTLSSRIATFREGDLQTRQGRRRSRHSVERAAFDRSLGGVAIEAGGGAAAAFDLGGVWVDEAFVGTKAQHVKVKALSAAYFRMLERHAELKELLALGNRLVWMTPNGTSLVIDTDGAETMCDAEIDGLFVANK